MIYIFKKFSSKDTFIFLRSDSVAFLVYFWSVLQ